MPPRAEIKTARLLLRPLTAADVAAVVDGLDRPEVSGWLTQVPAPYLAHDYQAFQPNARPGAVWVVIDAQGLAGVISINPHLGYWFAPDRWGRGYATEAGRAVTSAHFANPDAEELTSGYLTGNGASARVLQKLGFQSFGEREVAQLATGRMRHHVDMVLHRETFARAQPFRLETARLILATPDPERDLAAFLGINGEHQVARNLGSFAHPLPQDQARTRLVEAAWAGHIGFTLGLYLKPAGRFVGTVGLWGDPASTGYSLAPDLWGQGLMREAMGAFLPECFARFDLPEVIADHFADNSASGRVLLALGFERTGEGLGLSKARLEAQPILHYRVIRNNLRA